MKVDYRQFACDKCGAIHQVQTNHEGQIYMQVCKNWSCGGGRPSATMTFWGGDVELKETNFYANAGDAEKVKMYFKKAN